MRNFKIIVSMLFCMVANVRMHAQTPSDNKLLYASHAGDFAIHCRVNFYVFSATPITIDSMAMVRALDTLNADWNDTTQQKIGGVTVGPQMIPTNVYFHMNTIIPIVFPETSNLANWADYMLYYDSSAFWHMTHFVDDGDSIIDIIFVNNSLSPGPYMSGHMGLGISVMNIETADIDQYPLAKQMGHVFGIFPTYGGDTISFGTDGIPDTPPEIGNCISFTHSYCTNNIMGSSPEHDYFSPMQTGWIRKAILTDTTCFDDTSYGEYHCTDLLNDLFLGNYDLHRYIYTPSYVGLQDQEEIVLGIYPNPASNYITIVPDQLNGNVEIYNIAGTMVSITPNYQGEYIPVDHLPAGIYFVRYGRAASKLVISCSSW